MRARLMLIKKQDNKLQRICVILSKDKLIVVDHDFSSTQTCSVCGAQNHDLADDSIRSWVCSNCGTHHDRDVNAAVCIKKEGLKLLTTAWRIYMALNGAGTVPSNACGRCVRRETHCSGLQQREKQETRQLVAEYVHACRE